jgi:hypothetical protein
MWWFKRMNKKPDPVIYPFQFRIVYNSYTGFKISTDLIHVTVHARSKEDAVRIIRQLVPLRIEIEIIEKIITKN